MFGCLANNEATLASVLFNPAAAAAAAASCGESNKDCIDIVGDFCCGWRSVKYDDSDGSVRDCGDDEEEDDEDADDGEYGCCGCDAGWLFEWALSIADNKLSIGDMPMKRTRRLEPNTWSDKTCDEDIQKVEEEKEDGETSVGNQKTVTIYIPDKRVCDQRTECENR